MKFNKKLLNNEYIKYHRIIFFNVGSDVEVKDIATKIKNEIINVYWNIVNLHQLYTTILDNEPVKCMVRYKVIYF